MSTDQKARKLVAIGQMIAGYPVISKALGDDTARAYLAAVEDVSLPAVEAAAMSFLTGRATSGGDTQFPPSAPRFAEVARMLDTAAQSLSEGVRVIAYRQGEQPPKGTTPVGVYDERRQPRLRLVSR